MRSHYACAMAIFERTGDERSMGALLLNHGFLEREIGQYQRALEMFDSANRYASAVGAHGICAQATNRAEVALARGDLALAFSFSSKALKLCRETQVEQRFEAEALHTLGAVQVSRSEVEAGVANLLSALEKARRGELERVSGDIMCTLVDTFVALGTYAEADGFAQELARRFLERQAHQRFPTQICWTLAQYDRKRGAPGDRWLQRGRALLKYALARFELADDRDAFAAMAFNRALSAPRLD
jgi:ATP/maltotriose-dependent transcriptional regulator MalT